nr:hypothetical protein [Chloroflexota bacterium]
MSKVTYHEFRPGHWVKLVDGKIVGRATAEEVAAWKREKAEQATIWQDVVQQAAPVEPKPEAPPEAPPSKPKVAWTEPTKIWQDVLSQVSAAEPQPEHLPKATTQTKGKPERVPKASPGEPIAAPKVVSPKPEAKVKPKVAVKVVPAKRATEAEPALVAQPAPAKAISVKPAPKPSAKVKAVSAKQVAKAVPAPAVKAEPKIAKALPVEKPPATKRVSPPSPAKAKAVKQIAEAIPSEEEISSPVAPAEATTKPKRASTAMTRRSAAQPTPVERSSQLYLWIMAGLSDDLIATVRSGLARYQERFHQPAEVVLCHMDDMATLEKANLPVDVRQGKGVPPRSFWIGLK